MTHSDPALSQPTAASPHSLLELARRSLGADVALWREGEGGTFKRACQQVLATQKTVSELGFLGTPVRDSVFYAHASGRSWSAEDIETLELAASLLSSSQSEQDQSAPGYGEEVFQASPDCAKLLSLDGVLLKMNDNGCELMEIDDFSLLAGQPWPSLWPEPEIPASAVSEARTSGEAHFQSYCPTAKGTPKWWDVSVKRVPNPAGEGDVLLSVSREVEPQGIDLNELLETINEGVLVLSENAQVLYSNIKAAKLLGLKFNSLVGANLKQLTEKALWDSVMTLKRSADAAELDIFYEPTHTSVALRGYSSAVGFTLFLRDVSSRLEAAEADKLRETELRLALSASEMGVWNWDMQSDTVTTSAAFEKVWGFKQSPETFSSADIFTRVHPDDVPLMQKAIDKSVRDGVPYNVEFRVKDEDDTVRWLAGRGEVLKDETGTPVKMLGVNFDTTEIHEAEELAKQQAAILSLAHDPMIVWSEQEGITTWSRGAEALYGYSEAEALGQETHSLLKTEHLQPWEVILAALTESGEWSGLLIHTTKAGETLTVETRHQLIETGFGPRILEINHDISEELRLRARERQLASIIESAPSFIGITDTEGKAMYVNPAGRKMLNLGAKDVTEMVIADFHTPETVASHESEALPSALRDGFWTGESKLKTADNGVVSVLQTIVAHTEDDGSAYFSTIATDISRRLQVEAELSTLNRDLEERVAERTAALERSNAELDQFAYVASHDLKAPLRAVDSLASWISEDAAEHLPEASSKHLRTLRGRVKRMEKLLEDLLMFSRVDRQSHRVETVLLRDVMANVRRLAAVPDSFTLEVDYGVDTVSTVRTPLETVIRNLVSNAVKHHPRQDGHIKVSFEDNGELLEVSVTDNGEGINPDFHERIFGIFQTLKSRDEVEASGIGLAVVRKIVERRGGNVSVESEPGAGATFNVSWCKHAKEDSL